MLKTGDKAVDFALPGSDDKTHTLEEFKGKNVVLYFYPKDMTSGCTKEARKFASLKDEFKKLDAEIIGVSKDSSESHKKFIQKEDLNFLLLSDPDNNVAKAYGAYGEKSMYGKKYMGTIRSTFVIGKGGKIISAEYKVKPEESPVDSCNLLKNK